MASEAELYRQFLIEQKGATPEQADAFLKEKGMYTETFGDKALQSAKNIGKASIEALPLAGSLAGGVLGSAAGPVGTVAGAGLGAGAGKSLENLLEKYFLDEEKTRAQIYGDPALESLIGASGEAGGAMLAKGISKGLQKGGESFYKKAFTPIDLYAKKYGKDLMPSEVLFREGFTGTVPEAQEFAMPIIERELNKVTDVLKLADEAAIKQGVYSNPQNVYKNLLDSKKELEALSKFHEIPESIVKNLEEYTGEQIARQTPRRTYSAETGAAVLKNMEDYTKAMKEYESNEAARSLAEKWGIQAPEALAKPNVPAQLSPDVSIPGLLPSELSALKTQIYKQGPQNQWKVFAETPAGKEMLKTEALGMREETERLADLLVPELSGEVKRANEIAGTLLTAREPLFSEAAKQAKMPITTEVAGSMLGGSLTNPSVIPFLVGKEAVRSTKFMGPRTKIGMGAYKAGKAAEDSLLDPVLKSLLIKQMQGE